MYCILNNYKTKVAIIQVRSVIQEREAPFPLLDDRENEGSVWMGQKASDTEYSATSCGHHSISF